MANKQIDVVVTGDNEDGVQLVTGVVNKALLDNGFTNVGVMSPTTGEPTLVPDTPSLADIVRRTNPGLFHQPVTVTGLVPPGVTETPEYIERNIQQLEKYPKAAMTRYVLGSVQRSETPIIKMDDNFKEKIQEAEAIMGIERDEEEHKKHHRAKPKKDDTPSAAELSAAAKTLSKAAHANDHHPSTDIREAAEKLAAKAIDAL